MRASRRSRRPPRKKKDNLLLLGLLLFLVDAVAYLCVAALVAIDQLGDAARTVWPEAAAIEPGKDEEYSGRIVQRLRAKLSPSSTDE